MIPVDSDALWRQKTMEENKEGHPRETWQDWVSDEMKSLGLSQEGAQSRNKWRQN